MVGLQYLKYTYNESDESVVERFLENPYWQYFCGHEYFQHEFPLEPSSLVRWRNRVGAEGMEKLLKETIESAKRKKLVREQEVKRVNVDTTVQEKAIAFPTDGRLYHKMRNTLMRVAKKIGIELRQSYRRLSKKALARQGRYAHAKQMKRAKKETKKLKTYLGRLLREIEKKASRPTRKCTSCLNWRSSCTGRSETTRENFTAFMNRKWILGTETFSILNAYGISVASFEVVKTKEQALRVAKDLGYPVVLKVCSSEISHKSDVNGVRIGIWSELFYNYFYDSKAK